MHRYLFITVSTAQVFSSPILHYIDYTKRSPFSHYSPLKSGSHRGAPALWAGGIVPGAQPDRAPLQVPFPPVSRKLLPTPLAPVRGSSPPSPRKTTTLTLPWQRHLPSTSPRPRSPAPAPEPPSQTCGSSHLVQTPPPVRARTPRTSLPPDAARHFPPGKPQLRSAGAEGRGPSGVRGTQGTGTGPGNARSAVPSRAPRAAPPSPQRASCPRSQPPAPLPPAPCFANSEDAANGSRYLTAFLRCYNFPAEALWS